MSHLEVDTICLRSLEGLYDLIESDECDAVGQSLMIFHGFTWIYRELTHMMRL